MSDAIKLLAKEIAAELAPLLCPTTAVNPNQLLTVAEIAAELGVSRETVRQLIRAGTLPQAPDIREMRVKRSEVDNYGKAKP